MATHALSLDRFCAKSNKSQRVKIMVGAVDATDRRRRPPNSRVDTTFEYAIWPVLAVGQFFGMMPIIGVKCGDDDSVARSADRLQFRWFSLRVIWALVYLAVGMVLTYLYMYRINLTGITAKNLGGGIYFLCSLLCNLFFFRLARQWKALIGKWTIAESVFLSDPYQRCGYALSTKIRATAIAFFVLTFTDYLIFSLQTLYNYDLKSKACGWDSEDHLRRFYTLENRYIFEIIPFSAPLAVVKTLVDIINTVGCTYGHLFIMLISIGLSTRFKQLNVRMKKLMGKGKRTTETTWSEIRQHYVLLCELLDSVDVDMASIILLSCATNLYFICFQLLNIFEQLPHIVNYIYYWFSILYLIGRTICVFLCAAAINDASREPGDVIKVIQTTDWSSEVDRFSDQINGETIALSGMKFFYLTRKVLLTMLGTIITYELVLLQFAESTKDTDVKIETAESGC